MTKASVSLVGLPPDSKHNPVDVETVRAGISRVTTLIREAGYSFDFVAAEPEEGEEGIARIVKDVVDNKREGVVFGFGIRANAPITAWYDSEKVVNAVIEASPSTKHIYNSNPMNSLEAIERWFP